LQQSPGAPQKVLRVTPPLQGSTTLYFWMLQLQQPARWTCGQPEDWASTGATNATDNNTTDTASKTARVKGTIRRVIMHLLSSRQSLH
jgi:hypothetical protein